MSVVASGEDSAWDIGEGDSAKSDIDRYLGEDGIISLRV
jgi:hypothetical protein